jgi:hypothetical protein
MLESFRDLRKFSNAVILSRCTTKHTKDTEDSETDTLILLNFVLFETFVVKDV